MKRYIILSVLSLFVVISVSAQDDDMYFTPSKNSQYNKDIQSSQNNGTAGTGNGGGGYSLDADNDVTYYSGSIRDVDEYNRRDRFSWPYSQQTDEVIYSQDSVLVSVEDYENSMKMKRFDGYNNITLIVNDPWYYDPWYYNSYYWRGGWYWPWSYSFYDPWFYGPSWYGYWGLHGWGVGVAWHHPVYHRPAIQFRPGTGRPGTGMGRPASGYGYRRTPASSAAGRKAAGMIGNMRSNTNTSSTRTTTTRTTTSSRQNISVPSTRSSLGSGSSGRGSFGGSHGSSSRGGGSVRMSRR